MFSIIFKLVNFVETSNISRSLYSISSSSKKDKWNFYSISHGNRTPLRCITVTSMHLPWPRIFSVPLSANGGVIMYPVRLKHRSCACGAKASVTHCIGQHRNIGVKLQLLIAVSKLYEGLLLPTLETGGLVAS